MKFRLLYALLATVTAVAVVRAEEEEEDEDFGNINYYYANSKNRLTFGFQVNQGAKVSISNIGNVHPVLESTNSTTGQVSKAYTNGYVISDVARSDEKDSNGVQTSTQGGRYRTVSTDANGNPIISGDFLSYTPGQTRIWSYYSATQISADGKSVTMSQYSANSSGGVTEGKRNMSGGIDLQLIRQFSRPDARLRFSVVGGLSLNDINSKVSGTTMGHLYVATDTYTTVGGVQVPLSEDTSSPYAGPHYTSFPVPDGLGGTAVYEDTVPLLLTPTGHTDATDTGEMVEVSTYNKVKGAYYTLHLGPLVSARLFGHFNLEAGAGVSGGYVGTNFITDESFKVTFDGTEYTVRTAEASYVSKLLAGYYANMDLSWEVNGRTSMFAGMRYEDLGSYTQSVAGKTAKIDFGGSVGFRGGLSVKF